MPTESEMRSRRDSWPPTLVRLEPPTLTKDGEPRPLLDVIDDDEDPLTYFLTPAPVLEDEEGDAEMMDFDAGIEDPSQPREIVRSVSPSTLDGLGKPGKGRAASPDFDSDMTSHDEDEDEEYIRFSPNDSRLTSFRDLYIDGLGKRSQSPASSSRRPTNTLLSPASFPAPQTRGRAPAPRMGRSRSMSIRSRPSHLWREPSPDVWSIEEETEEEMSEIGSPVEVTNMDGKHLDFAFQLEQMAAKPKKKVRFLLPAKE